MPHSCNWRFLHWHNLIECDYSGLIFEKVITQENYKENEHFINLFNVETYFLLLFIRIYRHNPKPQSHINQNPTNKRSPYLPARKIIHANQLAKRVPINPTKAERKNKVTILIDITLVNVFIQQSRTSSFEIISKKCMRYGKFYGLPSPL